MEIEQLAQIIGLTFVGIICICIVWTIIEYIFPGVDRPSKQNKKLLDNIEKYK